MCHSLPLSQQMPWRKKLTVRDSEFLVNRNEICGPSRDGDCAQGIRVFWEVLPSLLREAPGLTLSWLLQSWGRKLGIQQAGYTVAISFFSSDCSADCYKLKLLSRALRMLVLSQFRVSYSFQKGTLTSFISSSYYSTYCLCLKLC